MSLPPSHSPETATAPIRMLMLGPPASGKGTQGSLLAARYGIPHVCAGDLLRRQVAAGTALGRAAESEMARGRLVGDDTMIEMMVTAIDESPGPGYLLDGFPRTLAQAVAWSSLVSRGAGLQVVVALEVPRSELQRRMHGRRRDSGRSDDVDEVFEQRLQVYDRATRPLLSFYERRAIVLRIDASPPAANVAEHIASEIDSAFRYVERASVRPPRTP